MIFKFLPSRLCMTNLQKQYQSLYSLDLVKLNLSYYDLFVNTLYY